MKYISVSNENKKKLARIFDVTKVAVWKALNFRSDSELSQKIRNVALREMNGRVIRELDITEWQPNCQTEFVHEDGRVTQVVSTFSNDVQVIIDGINDSATITMNNEEVRRFWNVTASNWCNVLYLAEQLSIL